MDKRPEDIYEDQKIEAFRIRGCNCTQGERNMPCCSSFSLDHYCFYRATILEMEKREVDLVIKSQLAAFTNTEEVTANRHFSSERKKTRTNFHHQGKPICRNTFLLLHCISSKKYQKIKTHFHLEGLTKRIHGNYGKKPIHSASPKDQQKLGYLH